ncbi:MAG: RnfABCDGE type electron transport complex subunit A [Erysipelotrichales bacterium]|nr:RnfABCDGE type electron transport complex subunit A [Erysipelotrichales bacterium]
MIQVFLIGIASSILINNIVLMQFMGICPFVGVSNRIESSIGMSAAVLLVLVIATLITYPIYHFVLLRAGIGFLDTITFILVIASLVQIVELLIRKFSPSLYRNLGAYLPLITCNCAVLGLVQINIASRNNFFESMTFAIGTGLGFALVMIIFTTMREQLKSADVSKSFKGIPIALISAGIMALAFFGLTGLV